MVLLESEVSLKTGDTAPDFNLKGIDDKMHTLNDYSQKGLLTEISGTGSIEVVAASILDALVNPTSK